MPPPDHYFEVILTPYLKRQLGRLLSGKDIPENTIKELLNAVKAARRYDLPLSLVSWEQWEAEAKKRGETLADFIYDSESRRKNRKAA